MKKYIEPKCETIELEINNLMLTVSNPNPTWGSGDVPEGGMEAGSRRGSGWAEYEQ